MRTSNLIVSVTMDMPEFWRWYAFDDDLDPDGMEQLRGYCDFEATVVMPQPTGWYLSLRFDVSAGWSELSLRRSRPDGTFDATEAGERHRLGRRHSDRRDWPRLDWADLRAVAERSRFTMFTGVSSWNATLLLAPWVGHDVDDRSGLAAHRRVVGRILTGRGLFGTADAGRVASMLLPAPAPDDPGPRDTDDAAATAMTQFRRQLELDGEP